MFEPKYLIRLDKKAFSHDQVVCLGSQLKSIVKNLSGLIESHVWFGADVDAISPMPKKLGVDSVQLRKIGAPRSIPILMKHLMKKGTRFLKRGFLAPLITTINLEGVLFKKPPTSRKNLAMI